MTISIDPNDHCTGGWIHIINRGEGLYFCLLLAPHATCHWCRIVLRMTTLKPKDAYKEERKKHSIVHVHRTSSPRYPQERQQTIQRCLSEVNFCIHSQRHSIKYNRQNNHVMLTSKLRTTMLSGHICTTEARLGWHDLCIHLQLGKNAASHVFRSILSCSVHHA